MQCDRAEPALVRMTLCGEEIQHCQRFHGYDARHYLINLRQKFVKLMRIRSSSLSLPEERVLKGGNTSRCSNKLVTPAGSSASLACREKAPAFTAVFSTEIWS